jgi:hypothetical protein
VMDGACRSVTRRADMTWFVVLLALVLGQQSWW